MARAIGGLRRGMGLWRGQLGRFSGLGAAFGAASLDGLAVWAQRSAGRLSQGILWTGRLCFLYPLEGKRVLLSVGRLTERKGLREFVENALPKIVVSCPDAMLLVVGSAPTNSLFARSQTTDSIYRAAKAQGVQANIRFVGDIKDYRYLSMVYRIADCHVFPVRQIVGDPEGFGMVAVEAAAHGLPTVAFATGGVLDAVGEGRSGRLINSGDYNAFSEAVIELLKQPDITPTSCLSFARRFEWHEFGRKVTSELIDAERVL